MHKSISFLLAFSVLVCFSGTVNAQNRQSLDSDLVKILGTFDSKSSSDPNQIPTLDQILEAKGTLIFFDNSDTVGPNPELGNLIKTKKSNVLERTLERAKRKLLGNKELAPENDPVFSQLNRAEPDFFNEQERGTSQPKILGLEYDGEKTIVSVPPDTYIEVPFLRHIPYFFSRIDILGNGSISVTETIQRVVEPNETEFYGIDRYYSKYHGDRLGNQYRTNLTIVEASVNGRNVEAKLLPSLYGIRLSVRENQPLPPGTHVYKINYLVSNKIADFKNSDPNAPDFKELIWSVTGHWNMPITRAGAVIIFPRDSVLYSHTAFTGSMLRNSDNFRMKKDSEGNISFALTYPLSDGEDFTVLASWAETNPAPFFQNGKLDKYILEHGTMTAAAIAFLFILSYYLATWISLKKNQVTSTVKAAPLRKDDLTPAVMHYALKKEILPKSLFIILLSMATKGFISFGEDDKGDLLLIKETDKQTALTPLEKKIARMLFSKESTSFSVNPANALRLTRMMDSVEKSLKKEHFQKFTTFHQTYFWFGILMAVISIAAISSLSLFPTITGLTALGCVLLFIPCYFIGLSLYFKIRKGDIKESALTIGAISVVFLPFVFGLIMLLFFYGIQTTTMTSILFLMTLICISIFYSLLQSPSILGSSILENMEGYKLYLSSQDDTLLTMMRNAEQKIKALYGKHLPFAAAMDLDKLWTRRFVAFSEKENQLKPNWYKGKLPFSENLIAELYTKFESVFPQKKPQRTGKVHSSRFKKTP